MGEETIRIMRRLDTGVAEVQATLQCAPLLTGIKISNLLQIRSDQIDEVFQMFEGTPVSCHVLSQKEHKTVLLVYRKGRLLNYLNQKDVRNLMASFGYPEIRLDHVLEKLSAHYQAYVDGAADFPHEIGLLLGYPPEDVTGFIENEGKNSLYTGYWKVYGDPDKAKKIFAGYDRAKEAAIRMAGNGLGVKDIMAFYNIMRRRQLIA